MRYIGLFLASLLVIVTVAYVTFNKSQKSRISLEKSAGIKVLPSPTPTPLPTPTKTAANPQLQLNAHIAAIHNIILAEVAPHEFIIERGIENRLVGETVLGFRKTYPQDYSELASGVLTSLYSYFSTNGFNTEQFDDSNSGRFNIHVSFTKAKIRCILHDFQDSSNQEITIEIGCNQFD